MPRAKLTAAFVDRLGPGDGQWFFDTEKPGLLLRNRDGAKTYYVHYGGGRRGAGRRVMLGGPGAPARHGAPAPPDPRTGLPREWSPETARDEADRVLGRVGDGRDPALERSAERQRPTLAELLVRVLREHSFLHKTQRSAVEDIGLAARIVLRDARKGEAGRKWRRGLAAEYRGGARAALALKDGALSELGRLRIDRITEAHVLRAHADGKGSPAEANRRVALLSLAFNLAESWGLRPRGSNPCRAVKRYREAKRERFLSPVELAQLGKALRKAERAKTRKAGRVDPFAAAAIRLCLLTGARVGEVVGAQWADVDLGAGTLRVERPKEQTPKLVRLNAPARALLKGLPRLKRNPHVFPGRKPGEHLTDLQHPWRRVVTLAKLDGVRLHDLRHSFASVLASGGASLPLIGSLLGHREPKTTQRYAHLSDDPRAAAAEQAGETIAAALAAPPRRRAAPPRDNVAPLRRRAR